MAIVDLKAPGLDQSSPEAHIQLDREMAKAVKKFRPGQVVRVTIIGKLCDMSFRKPEDPDLSGYEGNCCIEMTDMQIGESAKNAMAELLDDDE